MRVHELTSQFGWEGDDGLGLRLIATILDGTKTATCCPTAFYTSAEADEVRDTAGKLVTVIDRWGNPHGNIRILEVFETPWGAPDERVVRGEGFTSPDAWRRALSAAWVDMLATTGLTLTRDTPMLVELFELVDTAEHR